MSDEAQRKVAIWRRGGAGAVDDVVAVEEPLEIRVAFERAGLRAQKSIAITMRTPGNDDELAVGFLVGEQILRSPTEVVGVRYCGDPEQGRENRNVIRVELADGVALDLGRLQRNFYTTSSCGVCGKSSLEALALEAVGTITHDVQVDAATLARLPDLLRGRQEVFDSTGGLHAAGLFTPAGEFVALREDVGRHNAVDKLVGNAFLRSAMPVGAHVLVLSGRASFELLQKALVAGIEVVVAVGAPSSLAVELAQRFGITLCGFVRGGSFNCYSHPERIEGA